jgi:hypothetical protein
MGNLPNCQRLLFNKVSRDRNLCRFSSVKGCSMLRYVGKKKYCTVVSKETFTLDRGPI